MYIYTSYSHALPQDAGYGDDDDGGGSDNDAAGRRGAGRSWRPSQASNPLLST